MFDGMTIFERILLESLERQEKNLHQLLEDTALNETVLSRSLQNLISKNMVLVKRDQYRLNKEGKEQWKQFLLKEENLSLELQELLEGLLKVALKRNPESFMKIRKVHLDHKDEIILKAMLNNVETFLGRLESKQNRNSKTAERKVIVTGLATYQDILHTI
ncbi:MAG: hypothetical protein ACOYL6_09465 [Bacteriovoracaceae bacterium]